MPGNYITWHNPKPRDECVGEKKAQLPPLNMGQTSRGNLYPKFPAGARSAKTWPGPVHGLAASPFFTLTLTSLPAPSGSISSKFH